MATIRYTFRPSLFTSDRTIVVDETGVAELRSDGSERRIAWREVSEIHIEPATSGDEQARFVLHVNARDRRSIDIDSVSAQSATDFAHKGDEFLAVANAIHDGLAPRAGSVRFVYGARRGVLNAWRIALWFTLAAGIFAAGAAIVSEEYDLLFGSIAFIGSGISGLTMLRGRKGPRPYDFNELRKQVGVAVEPKA
ncbi:MAG TPA: hypothetical protein VFB16_15855 [Bauldia sp.]|nr:hypothetical protein [Bauldia sp.]